jgi:hypothetical protein
MSRPGSNSGAEFFENGVSGGEFTASTPGDTNAVVGVYLDLSWSPTQGRITYFSTSGPGLVQARLFTKNGKTFHPTIWMLGINGSQQRATIRTLSEEITQGAAVVGFAYSEWAERQRPGMHPWIPAYLPVRFEWFDTSDDLDILQISNDATNALYSASRWWETTTAAMNAGTSSQRPSIVSADLNGFRTIEFDGSGNQLNLATGYNTFYRNVGAAWAFAVARHGVTDGSNTERAILGFGTNAGSAFRTVLYSSAGDAQNRPGVGGRRLDSDSFNRAQSSAAFSQQWGIHFGLIDYQARTITFRLNGEQLAHTTGAFTASGNTSDTDSTRARLGANLGSPTPTARFIGKMNCAIFGREIPSTDDQERLEGFFAHRLGLEGDLPGGHTYKSAAPTL